MKLQGKAAGKLDDPIVFVVHDDDSMRSALGNLIRSVGFQVEMFSSGPEFLARKRPAVPACLVSACVCGV